MLKRNFEEILELVAQINSTTPQEVRREMLLAMEAGQSTNDLLVQARWNAIPRKGETLTLEEFFNYLVKTQNTSQS